MEVNKKQVCAILFIIIPSSKFLVLPTLYAAYAKQDAWFAGYVAAASSKGIISGIGDGSFGVGRDISRQEAAVILDRILTLFGAASGSAAAEFADSEEIAAWAAEGVNRLTKCGIISGIDGSFCPADAVTRAQAAQMIFGCMQYAGTVR